MIGVSKDTIEAQKKFADKHDLKMPLLADANADIIRAYGVAKASGSAERKSFIVDSKGKIAKVYDKVNPATHAKEVNEALASVP